LTIKSKNLAKSYAIETNAVIGFLVMGQRKMRGGENEGIFHYVIENKWWKNVRNRPLHYINEKTGGYTRLSIILMKIKVVVRRVNRRQTVLKTPRTKPKPKKKRRTRRDWCMNP
jgi:hypothetical protein